MKSGICVDMYVYIYYLGCEKKKLNEPIFIVAVPFHVNDW